jgi:hypothetical protein
MAGPNDNQNPINPNLTDAVNRMATASDVFAKAASTMEQSLDAAAKHTEVMMKNLDSTKLADLVAIFDSVEESTKEISNYARKMRMGIFNSKDAGAAAKYAKQILEAQKELQKKTKENTAAWQQANKSAAQLQKFIEKIGDRVGDLNQNELREFGRYMIEAEQSGAKLVKHFRDMKVGDVRRQMNAIMNVVAPGASARSSARVAKHSARRDEIAEQQRTRLGQNRLSQEDRRERALASLRADKNTPKGLLTSSGDLDLKQEGARQLLGARMGFRGKRAQTFVRGEHAMSLGAASGGEDYEKLMTHGGGMAGALSSVASTVENLGMVMEGAMAALGPEIEILAAVMGALIEALDKIAKQNQAIEQNTGKAGIFNTGAGAGAFGAARAALNPRSLGSLGFSQLGVTFERNTAIAGAMAQGGYNLNELTQGGQETANMGPGAKGDFMQGPIGEVQRVVMGVGRLAGLTDVEGVERVLKNLSQYGQTIQSTEKFFVQLNKDTQAAGISTTKYLQIIDEVSDHFDRFNKSLNETMGLLRNLGRTGAIGGESLKELADFLAGSAKPNMQNAAQRGFIEMNMSKGMRDARTGGYTNQILGEIGQNVIPQLMNTLPANLIPGNLGNIGSMKPRDAQNMIQGMKDRLAHAVDAKGNPLNPTTKTQATAALDQLSGLVTQLDASKRGGGLDRAFMSGLTGQDLLGSMTQRLTAVQIAAKNAGVPMTALMSGDFSGLSGKQAAMMQSMMTEVTGINDPAQAANAMKKFGTVVGQSRLDQAYGDKSSAKELVKQLVRKGLFKGILHENMTGDESLAALKSIREGTDPVMQGKLLNETAGMAETQEWFVKNQSKVPRVLEEQRKDALEQARELASQTQPITEAIKNALNVWMTKLVGGIDFIVKHWIWGGGQEDLAAANKAYQAAKGNFDSVNTTLESEMGENRRQAQKATGAAKQQLDDQYSSLSSMQSDIANFKENGFSTPDDAKRWNEISNNASDFANHLKYGSTAANLGPAAVGTQYGPMAADNPIGGFYDRSNVPQGTLDPGLASLIQSMGKPGASSITINQGVAVNPNIPGDNMVDSNETAHSGGHR